MTRTTDELLPPLAYATPNWLTQQSAWVMHIPFAFTLVDALRPRTIVELGVHAGDSYAAWCQAVDALALESRCYGIDTWEGDAHAGAYAGSPLLSALRRHHDPRYGRFSQLLQATFDEALGHVDDASIDLLHIDGFHTYEAVSHDFESWSPKLSDRAVVVFHDTNVREADFGVHRYWSEIRDRHPSFEFLFGHGLGVLGVGSALPDAARVLFELSDPERESLTRMLSALGERVSFLSGYRRIDEVAKGLGWPVSVEYFGRITADGVEGLKRAVDGLERGLQAEREARDDWEVARQQMDDDIDRLNDGLAAAHERIQDYERSTSWRITAPLRRVRRRNEGPEASGTAAWAAATPGVPIPSEEYVRWLTRYGGPSSRDGLAGSAMADGPRISVLIPVYMPDLRFLRRAVQSVVAQNYPRWELCIADDASTDPEVHRYLTELAESDERIQVTFRPENGHISACTNSALALATGDFVAFLDQDDELASDALAMVAAAAVERPDVAIIYSDEDKIDGDGRHSTPYFKSDFDAALILGQNYLNHLTVIRRSVVMDVGGLREGFEGSQDHDLILRCLHATGRDHVHHVPHVLYHWRAVPGSTAMSLDEKGYAGDAARRAIADHLLASGVDGTVEPGSGGYQRVRPNDFAHPPVTIVIPTRNGVDLLRRCIDSIRDRTTYSSYDLIIVDNGSDDPETLAYLGRLAEEPDVTFIRDEGPFNYSRLNNEAVREATGEFVVLLNNDTEVVTPEWLDELVFWGRQPGVGSVGCKLLYPDRTIQHAGVVVGIGGVAGHSFKGARENGDDHFGYLNLAREVTCSTAACLLVRRADFLAVGGLDETNLAVAFNDVDLGLRLRDAGLRNIWTPSAVLIHHESKTRGSDDRPSTARRFRGEWSYMRRRWTRELDDDPYYNPNLSLDPPGYGLASPPRRRDRSVRGGGVSA